MVIGTDDPRPQIDPLAPVSVQRRQAQEIQADRRDERLAEIRAAFGNSPDAVAYLRACLDRANATPSYQAGHDLGLTAYNEGRRGALRELVRAIDLALNPDRTK